MSLSNPELPQIPPHLRLVKNKRDSKERTDIQMLSWEDIEPEAEDQPLSLADRLEAARDRLEMYEERLAVLQSQIELPPMNRIWAEKSDSNQPSDETLRREIKRLRYTDIPRVEARIMSLEAEVAEEEPRLRAVNE